MIDARVRACFRLRGAVSGACTRFYLACAGWCDGSRNAGNTPLGSSSRRPDSPILLLTEQAAREVLQVELVGLWRIVDLSMASASHRDPSVTDSPITFQSRCPSQAAIASGPFQTARLPDNPIDSTENANPHVKNTVSNNSALKMAKLLAVVRINSAIVDLPPLIIARSHTMSRCLRTTSPKPGPRHSLEAA